MDIEQAVIDSLQNPPPAIVQKSQDVLGEKILDHFRYYAGQLTGYGRLDGFIWVGGERFVNRVLLVTRDSMATEDSDVMIEAVNVGKEFGRSVSLVIDLKDWKTTIYGGRDDSTFTVMQENRWDHRITDVLGVESMADSLRQGYQKVYRKIQEAADPFYGIIVEGYVEYSFRRVKLKLGRHGKGHR